MHRALKRFQPKFHRRIFFFKLLFTFKKKIVQVYFIYSYTGTSLLM